MKILILFHRIERVIYGRAACLAQLLDVPYVEVGRVNAAGWTAFSFAMQYGCVACARLLLDRGAL